MLRECPFIDADIDQSCLDYIERTFVFIKVKGTGSHGVVIQLSKQRVLKIITYDHHAKQEINVACKVNQLLEHSDCFIRTYGWISCHRLPQDWIERIGAYGNMWPQYPIFMCILMEEVPYDKISLLEEDVFMLLFELLHAIYIARKLYKYSHNDIHDENIMFALAPSPVKAFHVEDQTFTLVNRKFVPKLIDQGRASFGEIRQTRDLAGIEEIVLDSWLPENNDRFHEFFLSPTWEKCLTGTSSDYLDIVDALNDIINILEEY